VIARTAPDVRVLDITHQVPPQDIRRGAAVLAQTLPALPEAIHLAVVDPGVGTDRRAVLIGAGGHVFAGPDNGLLTWAVDLAGGAEQVIVLPVPDTAAATFHGRDVFAPAVARLATGTPMGALGTPAAPSSLVRLPAPVTTVTDGTVRTEVLTVDVFGNVQLAATPDDLQRAGLAGEITVAGHRCPVRSAYGQVGPGELVACQDSAGQLAVAVNAGNAAMLLRLSSGDRVVLGPVETS
jgi:S-adenosylmethionine hydrolase